MLDPPIHNRPFADKRDKLGMDGVPTLVRKWRERKKLMESATNRYKKLRRRGWPGLIRYVTEKINFFDYLIEISLTKQVVLSSPLKYRKDIP